MGVEKGGGAGEVEWLKSPCWLLVLSAKTPSVRTCGLKPSTLKQLGQSIQQPSSTGEVKVRPSSKRRTIWKSGHCVYV